MIHLYYLNFELNLIFESLLIEMLIYAISQRVQIRIIIIFGLRQQLSL
jgi:hypothetical protein